MERGIGLINASPLHMGILTEAGPPAWHMAPAPVLEAGRRVAALCQAAGCDVAGIALRFCLGHPNLATTLIGMSNEEQVRQNVIAAATALPAGLMTQIEQTLALELDAIWPWGKPEVRL